MSASYTANLKLGKPADNDPNWGATANTTFATIDALAPVAAGNVTPTEVPSASLGVAVAPASVWKGDGTVGSYAGGTSTLNANTTTYLYLDPTPALVAGTGWPGTAHVRLAVAVTNGTVVTSVADARVAPGPAPLPLAGGTLADGADVAVGATTGTKIATNTAQKLGFFGAAPVVRPTMGAATATNTYTTSERAMLQAVYDAVRNLGLGS